MGPPRPGARTAYCRDGDRRTPPDTDTVRALEQLALLEVYVGSPDGDRLTTEALILGQALDVGDELLSGLLLSRGMYLGIAQRRGQAVAYLREAARLASQAADNVQLGRVLLNLSDVLAVTDPAAAAAAARGAVEHLRRTSVWDYLTYAITNLIQAQLTLGDGDSSRGGTHPGGGIRRAGRHRLGGLLSGLAGAFAGDADTAETMLAGLHDLRASEDFPGQVPGQPREGLHRRHPPCSQRHTLRNARSRSPTPVISASPEFQRWAWPLAIRLHSTLRDTAAIRELLALLDSHQPGHVAPMLRAERDLARARLAAREGDEAAGAAFAAAITGLRAMSTPYHLAQGLLDHARHLSHLGDHAAAALTIDEARDIAHRLRCQPLLDRIAALTPAGSRAEA